MYTQFKKWFQDKVGIGENRDKLALLEKKLHYNNLLIQNMLSDVFELASNKQSKELLNAIPEIENVPLSIHKNDIMFLAYVYRTGNFNKAIHNYFKLGYATANQIKEVVEEYESALQLKYTSFLDFGAGYGRISRFLPIVLGKERNYSISEIKKEAVQFNKDYLNLNGFWHEADASAFSSDHPFDIIFAGSVFSHLPENLAYEWLDQLKKTLSSKGILLFTTHNIALSNNASANTHFHFESGSEDSFFNTVGDHLENESSYGTAYISDEGIRQMMEKHQLNFEIKPKWFGNKQDLIIAWQK